MTHYGKEVELCDEQCQMPKTRRNMCQSNCHVPDDSEIAHDQNV